MAYSLRRAAPREPEDPALRPLPVPKPNGLARVEQEAEEQIARSRRTVWLSLLLGAGLWAVLIVWAVLAPRLSDRAHLVFGVLVGTETAAMGYLLAVYAHVSQVRVLQHHLARLRELAQRLEELSERDSLTGLYNHGYLLRRLQEEISLAQRHGRALSLIILDLDDFKDVNDRHGHLVGDEVLQCIAASIRQQMRQHDVVARYGGDEFCLVLPETDLAGASRVVEKLRGCLAGLSERLEWAGGQVSFGCGLSACPDDGATARALLAAADARLYEEKRLRQFVQAQPAWALWAGSAPDAPP